MPLVHGSDARFIGSDARFIGSDARFISSDARFIGSDPLFLLLHFTTTVKGKKADVSLETLVLLSFTIPKVSGCELRFLRLGYFSE